MSTAVSTISPDDSADEITKSFALADELYRRVDWQWRNGGAAITHGWKPKGGFLKYRWQGYDEALLLYLRASVRRRIRSPGELRRVVCHLSVGKSLRSRVLATPARLFIPSTVSFVG